LLPGSKQLLAPKLGEHSEEILKGLGYTDSDIQALKASGAIG
jgi:crotonobetainyl-CoA:carnitine CoA-transferase CaiB-like acyl-CoA transferase